MSSFSFLSDAFPNYSATDSGKGLFEDFTSPQVPQGPQGPQVPTQQKKVTPPPEDHDLLMKDLDHRVIQSNTTNKVPEAFDASSDYFKILASKWEPAPKEQNVPNGPNGPNRTKEHSIGCMNVAEHIDKCTECRVRLEQIFRKLFAAPLKPPTQVIVEPQPPKRDTPVYLEMALLLLLGIFIVFVLDAFVRLGKYFKTR
jgi:hypothetical protein